MLLLVCFVRMFAARYLLCSICKIVFVHYINDMVVDTCCMAPDPEHLQFLIHRETMRLNFLRAGALRS